MCSFSAFSKNGLKLQVLYQKEIFKERQIALGFDKKNFLI